MKTANLVGLGALALAAYLLYKNTMSGKGGASVKADDKSPDKNASMAGYGYANGYQYASGYGYASGPAQDSRVTLEDLSVKPGLQTRWSLRVPRKPRRPEIKRPIYIDPLNAIPNVYDRGVGARVVGMDRVVREPYMNADGQQMYATFGGRCSENIQRACRCVTGKTDKYKLDIPDLP
jgi:hypothetical protein